MSLATRHPPPRTDAFELPAVAKIIYSTITMALVSAAPFLLLLNEPGDYTLKEYALKLLNDLVNNHWAEIANSLDTLEQLWEDTQFPLRQLAALVVSKCYYNLGDYDQSVNYALLAGPAFDINEKSQYVEQTVSRCIAQYTEAQAAAYHGKGEPADHRLLAIFEQMLHKCQDDKLALGLALETYRLDVIRLVLNRLPQLVSYVLGVANQVVLSPTFRTEVLNALVEVLMDVTAPQNPEPYYVAFRIVVQLNDTKLAVRLLDHLVSQGLDLVAYQGAFDLVSSAHQQFLVDVAKDVQDAKVKMILLGVPLCDLDLTFLYKNNAADVGILNRTKDLLEGRLLIFHLAVTFANAYMHAGTTDDLFFRKNLEWLGKATNWLKFLATAALGVIHKGNLSHGRTILRPYLPPGAGGSAQGAAAATGAYTRGGSLFALGLIFSGHGKEVLDYLKHFIDDHGNAAGTLDTDVMLHGACLGAGVAGMGCRLVELYEALKVVLYLDLAVLGQAAGIAMGLVMLGLGSEEATQDMLTYAKETQHEHIIRGLAIGVALLQFGRMLGADAAIEDMLSQELLILRYGGAFTLALAYCGTGDNGAIQKLLHLAVLDPLDDVRRAAVLGLGFVLVRDHTQAPQLVRLLSQLHNPHVRYGAAMALGIAGAGKAHAEALAIVEPLLRDPVDFVRQAAHMALALILIQQTETTFPTVTKYTKNYVSTIKAKHEDALAKFGATLAQGIIDAGGRNLTISLENAHTNTLNTPGVIGLALFCQLWYWFPMAHFLLLSFAPTTVIGVTLDLKAPKAFDVVCHCKPEVFVYPSKVEENKEQKESKFATAVLLTTAKHKRRQRKDSAVSVSSVPSAPTTTDVAPTSSAPTANEEKEEKDKEQLVLPKHTKDSYRIANLTRVVPLQVQYIGADANNRFQPVRKLKLAMGGVVVLTDLTPDEPKELIKTVRQLYITEAPVPEPFTLEDEDEEA